MYAYIKGELTEKRTDSAVVEAGGIGFEIFLPLTVLERLPSIGETVKIYTFHYIREDANLLYGFLSREDQKLFEMILGVSGIGPKGALSILSCMTVSDLRFAILSGDSKAISKAQGIGSKTAQRLILELKDKIDAAEAAEAVNNVITANDSIQNSQKRDAISALVALGYSSSDASSVISKLDITDDMDTEAILKAALRQIAFL